jgi:hypothetical protein
VAPGDPVALQLPAGATGLSVVKPDGTTVLLAPGTTGGTSVGFSETDRLGVYTATATFEDGSASPSPGSGASAPPAITPAPAGPSGSPSASATSVPVDPRAPVRFAVDLFDTSESDIAPGSPATITALGQAGGGSPAPSGSTAPGSAAQEPRAAARDELWVPIVLLILAALTVEWLVFHRDAVRRLWRRLRPVSAGPVAER